MSEGKEKEKILTRRGNSSILSTLTRRNSSLRFLKNQLSKILQDFNPTFAEFKRQSNIGLKFSDTKSHASGYDEPTNSDC